MTDWAERVDGASNPKLEAQAVRHLLFTTELVDTLGVPELVTDPQDGVTRLTWRLEVPYDVLAAMCEESNARMAVARCRRTT